MTLELPWLPPAEIVRVDGRGEFFVRRHQHRNPSRPTLLLLHGWTASADLQFFSAYRELAEQWSFIALDHRGHGRGLRTVEPFTLEDVADDAAAVSRQLGVERTIVVGYSMGGPVSMLLARRHRDLVAGLVPQATALEWRATRRERLMWKLLPLAGTGMRSRFYARYIARGLPSLIPDDHPLAEYRTWVAAETRRNFTSAIIQAGTALSKYDARPWVGSLDVPAAMLITTGDRLVKPRKQRALAAALGAEVRELAGDHLAPWEQPTAFAALTVELVADVATRVGRAADQGSAEFASA
ncbi:MAG: alpha/beta hydrolase [Actinomycetota bacterium]